MLDWAPTATCTNGTSTDATWRLCSNKSEGVTAHSNAVLLTSGEAAAAAESSASHSSAAVDCGTFRCGNLHLPATVFPATLTAGTAAGSDVQSESIKSSIALCLRRQELVDDHILKEKQVKKEHLKSTFSLTSACCLLPPLSVFAYLLRLPRVLSYHLLLHLLLRRTLALLLLRLVLEAVDLS